MEEVSVEILFEGEKVLTYPISEISSLKAMKVDADTAMNPPCATPKSTKKTARGPVEVAPSLREGDEKSETIMRNLVKKAYSQSKGHNSD